MAEWQGITEYVTVVETGSFTAAAALLNVSVAHISRKVGQLEDRLGAKLLYRTTRRVTVTEMGEVFFQHCRPLLSGLEDAQRAITDLQDRPQGVLRMTAPMAYGERTIIPLLNAFLQDYPELDIDINLTNRQVDLISNGLDMAIRLGNLGDSSLKARKLTSRSLHVCAAPAYINRHGEPHSLSELAKHSCLLGTLDHWRLRENGLDRNIKVKGRLRCNSGPALVDGALRGLGLVQLPNYYVEEALAQKRLVTVLSQHQPKDEGIWAVYPPNRHLSPKVRLLIDYLVVGLSPGRKGHQVS